MLLIVCELFIYFSTAILLGIYSHTTDSLQTLYSLLQTLYRLSTAYYRLSTNSLQPTTDSLQTLYNLL
jgi:ABC-type Na+ efflux pump permease subunit